MIAKLEMTPRTTPQNNIPTQKSHTKLGHNKNYKHTLNHRFRIDSSQGHREGLGAGHQYILMAKSSPYILIMLRYILAHMEHTG